MNSVKEWMGRNGEEVTADGALVHQHGGTLISYLPPNHKKTPT